VVKQYFKRWGLLVAAVLATGCSTYSLKELRHAKPSEVPYQQALATLYMNYAMQEEKNYDWFTSMHFADKGLMAIYGKDVQPENLEDWQLPAEVIPTMEKAREQLVRMLTQETKRDFPQQLAEAVYNFDCWVEQQYENWQWEDIARCRDGLARAFEQMGVSTLNLTPMADPEASSTAPAAAPVAPVEGKDEGVPPEDDASEPMSPESDDMVSAPQESEKVAMSADEAVLLQQQGDPQTADMIMKSQNKTEVSASPAAPPPGVETSSYMVFFEENLTTLPDAGTRVVDEIAKTLTDSNDYSVVIGASEHVEFVEKRAQAVKNRLIEGGVDASAITVSVSKVPDFSADGGEGDSAPIRHRVEIYLNQ
jgi:outer membrane protein OmpA-like peptidoglycan-associated protein